MYNHCHFLPDVFDTLTEVAGNRTSHFLCLCFSDTQKFFIFIVRYQSALS